MRSFGSGVGCWVLGLGFLRTPSTQHPTPGLLAALLVALLSLLVPAAAHGQAARQGLVVDSQIANPRFPDGVDFTLQAHGFRANRAQLNYSLVGQPVTQGIHAEVTGTTSDLNLAVILDLSVHYIPPGTEIAYYWTLADDSGQVDTPQKVFIMLDERHRWHVLDDAQKRVSVHWYEGDQAFGNRLLVTASGALDRLQRDIGAGLQRRANVWIYPTTADLLDALPKFTTPEWAAGEAIPELGLVFAAIPNQADLQSEIKRILPHELSHLLLYQATSNPYNAPPLWLNEGLAEHNQQAWDPAEEQALRQAAVAGKLVPLRALSGSFGATEEEAVLAYGESRNAVDFLLSDSRYGPEKFARTVAAFRNGVTYDEAFKAGLGATMDEIDSQWQASLPHPLAAPAPGAAKVQSNPAVDVLSSPLALGALGICGALFLAGALLTAIAVVRRRNA